MGSRRCVTERFVWLSVCLSVALLRHLQWLPLTCAQNGPAIGPALRQVPIVVDLLSERRWDPELKHTITLVFSYGSVLCSTIVTGTCLETGENLLA